jgi:hypothetical protein
VYNVLCPSGPYSIYFAEVYLETIDFISISVALYGLFLFYGLTKDELEGRRPLAKFLSIKLIVMFTFYQSFVIDSLEGSVIQATQYWTSTNIADGLNALAICIEMVFFSILMMWAYTWNEYKIEGAPKTSIWRPLWDSINYTDFVVEILGSLRFFYNNARKKSSSDPDPGQDVELLNQNTKRMNFGQAFGVDNGKHPRSSSGGESSAIRRRPSYDEEIRLAPYPYNDAQHATSAGSLSV